MRRLVTVRKIEELSPIPGADAIEIARVDGWEVVTKKGQFGVGDLAAYYEIDSFLPIKPEYEFLRKSSYKKMVDGTEGFRLKTIRLRGQLSQGLLMPLDEVCAPWDIAPKEGDDLTEELGVTKWEPAVPVQIAGTMKGNFPTALFPKTDEPRIQNCTRILDYMRISKGWYGREKLDGTSISMYWDGTEFGVCSRNWELKEEESHPAWEIAREHDVAAFLAGQRTCYALQGELIGPGIQKNRYRRNRPEWRLFSVYDIAKECYVDETEFMGIAEGLGLDICPLIYKMDYLPGTIQEILALSEVESALLSGVEAEGVVWRNYRDGEREYSFKAINNRFLLKEKNEC
jgi:RNA ligase (TIGR02306 family)